MMNVFWLLILAHLIADFPLQTDRVYDFKKRYRWGVLLHVLIGLITNIVLTLPYLHLKSLWAALLLLVVTHLLVDRAKIILTQRWGKDNLWLFGLDQGLHLTTIWLVSGLIFRFPAPSSDFPLGEEFYRNEKLIVTLCGIIFSVFAGAVVIYYLRLLAHQLSEENPKRDTGFPPMKMRLLGYGERFIFTTGLIWGGWLYPIVPLAFLPRLITGWKKEDRGVLSIHLLAGLLISLGVAMAVKGLT